MSHKYRIPELMPTNVSTNLKTDLHTELKTDPQADIRIKEEVKKKKSRNVLNITIILLGIIELVIIGVFVFYYFTVIILE